jgi:hypothetical protein
MNEHYHYILDGHDPVAVDLMTWERWREANQEKKRVALDQINDTRVSTIFFGLDLSLGDGPPLIFETMTFGGALSDGCEHYSTWAEAVAGHAAMCERVRSAQGKEDSHG